MITTAHQPERPHRAARLGHCQLIETKGVFCKNRFVLLISEVAQSQSRGEGDYHSWKN